MAGARGSAVPITGERVIVFLFVARVLFSAPISLAGEAASLALLAVAALALEISVEGSATLLHRFKARPGASSGVLLGMVTLPTVMLSRLIQSARLFSSLQTHHEEFSYVTMLYWGATIGCFGVLLFFQSILQRPSCNTGLLSGTVFVSKRSFLYIMFTVVACYLSFVTKSFTALDIIMNLMWFFCHGVVTVLLIRHILCIFPSCASIGEALLVSNGVVLSFSVMLAQTLSKIGMTLTSKQIFREYGAKSEISTIIQGLLLGLLLFSLSYKFILRIWVYFKSKYGAQGESYRCSEVEKSILFYASLSVLVTAIAPAWMYFVQDFHVHPLLWVVHFVFSEPFKRMALCVYWICVICGSVQRFYNISKHSKIERILLRKYYHLVAVLMFVPVLLFQPAFLDLAFGAALCAFLILEMIRVWEIKPLGHIIHHFMNAFTDHRDSEILIISHFSLLLGCALPKWLSFGVNDRPLAPFAGILSLGIGDTMASMVGHKYGVLRWSKTGKKTIEGTAAGITSVLVACSLLLPLLASTMYISQNWLSLVVAVFLSGLLEAFTAQLDNAFIPLVFYSLLCL